MNDHSPATISVETLPVIAYQGLRVVTTDLLAQVYGTDSKNLRMNFANNEARFVTGKHFFKLEGEALSEFKSFHRANRIGSVEISPRAKALTLWTERGAARHAKMLDTDQAWEVFERMEDAYFRAPVQAPPPAPEPPALDFEQQAMEDLLRGWITRWGSRPMYVMDLVRACADDADLAALIESACGDEDPWDPAPAAVARRLGYRLRSFAGRTVGRLRLRSRSSKSSRGVRWFVESVHPDAVALPAPDVEPEPLPSYPPGRSVAKDVVEIRLRALVTLRDGILAGIEPLPDRDPPRYAFPAETARPRRANGDDRINAYALAEQMGSPLADLLRQLKADGHDIDGPLIQYHAMRGLLLHTRTTWEDLRRKSIDMLDACLPWAPDLAPKLWGLGDW